MFIKHVFIFLLIHDLWFKFTKNEYNVYKQMIPNIVLEESILF